MTKLRRGFVSEANRWALDLREELQLRSADPMCPWQLTTHLSVPVYPLKDLPPCPERELLYGKSKGLGFSAAACFDGFSAFILHNDIHDPKRQASDLAHELGHILLRHPPANPFHPDGIREFSDEHELEAERLGPTLLVSDAAAIDACRLLADKRFTLQALSDHWGITEEVIRMRINLSGAKRRLQYAA